MPATSIQKAKSDLVKTDRPAILVVDDDESQRSLIQLTFTSISHNYDLHLLASGNEAIAYLAGRGKFEDRKTYPLPACIITDLHMPNGDGRAVLGFVKKNRALSAIPVAVLSSSENPEDIRQCQLLGCTFYFAKPFTQTQLLELLEKTPGYPRVSSAPRVKQRSSRHSASPT